MSSPVVIPSNVSIESAFWGPEFDTGFVLVGTVIAILRDSQGDQYCVFEMADQAGLQIIHLGSNFFKGFTHEC